MANTQLSHHASDLLDDPHLCRCIMGVLQYATITLPNISFVINKVTQFMHDPTSSHWIVVKWFL